MNFFSLVVVEIIKKALKLEFRNSELGGFIFFINLSTRPLVASLLLLDSSAFLGKLVKMNQNKFIVIEGPDGAGKKTQFLKLADKLKNIGLAVETFDFPQYDKPSSHFVREYLAGNFGGLNDVGPHKSSIFFALDRFGASMEIHKALSDRKIVLSNRYVASNMAHQGAKIHALEDRKTYFEWLFNLEYHTLSIAKPGLNIILYVAPNISQELLLKTGKTKDIHETDVEYQKRVGEIYKEIAELFPGDFKLIDCMDGEKLLPKEIIEQKIWTAVKEYLKI